MRFGFVKMVVSLDADLCRGASLTRFGFGKAGGSGGRSSASDSAPSLARLECPTGGTSAEPCFPDSSILGMRPIGMISEGYISRFNVLVTVMNHLKPCLQRTLY